MILLTLFQLRSTSDLTGFSALREVPVAPDCLAVPHLPVPCHYDGLRRLAVLRFYVFDGGHGSLLRPCRVLLAVQDHLIGLLTTVSRDLGRPHARLAALPAVKF